MEIIEEHVPIRETGGQDGCKTETSVPHDQGNSGFLGERNLSIGGHEGVP